MDHDEGSDEDEEDGGWLTQKFDNPPISASSRSEDRRPLDPGGLPVSIPQQNCMWAITYVLIGPLHAEHRNYNPVFVNRV